MGRYKKREKPLLTICRARAGGRPGIGKGVRRRRREEGGRGRREGGEKGRGKKKKEGRGKEEKEGREEKKEGVTTITRK